MSPAAGGFVGSRHELLVQHGLHVKAGHALLHLGKVGMRLWGP